MGKKKKKSKINAIIYSPSIFAFNYNKYRKGVNISQRLKRGVNNPVMKIQTKKHRVLSGVFNIKK